jgi:hypothetical protein
MERKKLAESSENRSSEIAAEALPGAEGYFVKSDAVLKIFPALQALLQGVRFVSTSLAIRDPTGPTDHHIESHRLPRPNYCLQ